MNVYFQRNSIRQIRWNWKSKRIRFYEDDKFIRYGKVVNGEIDFNGWFDLSKPVLICGRLQ